MSAVGNAFLATGHDETTGRQVYILIGEHFGTAGCWCQPRVAHHYCRNGHDHLIVHHNRTMDGVQNVVGSEWYVTEDGGIVFPDGQDDGEVLYAAETANGQCYEGPTLTAPRRRPDNDDLAERDARPGPPTGEL